MRYLQSVVQPNTDLPASALYGPFDLPVNPLSAILLSLEVTNVAPAALDTYQAIDDVIDQITSIIVKHKGESIIQGSLRDLMVLNAVKCGRFPGWHSMSQVDNDIRTYTFPLCFGRRMFDPKEAFPATTRGNLTMELTAGADGAGYDDINVQVEAIELIEADPEAYLKYTTQARASVVGQFDQSLPIGNPILAILGFDTTMAAQGVGTSSWGTIKLLKDNVEQYFPNSDAQVLAAMLAGMLYKGGSWIGHTHQFNGAAAGLDETDEADYRASIGGGGYFLLDFDPLGDGTYMLETEGAADLKVRGNGDAAAAVRLLPIEYVRLK